MRFVLISCLLLSCVFARHFDPEEHEARRLYEQFKRDYGRNHANEEDDKRFTIFKDNLRRIKELQTGKTAEYGITQFADLTNEEFTKTYANLRPGKLPEVSTYAKVRDDIPESFDWRNHGAVGKVISQGNCGSCWAFSVIGNIEGQWFKKTGQLLSLSQQQLVDCDEVDYGCSGGWPPSTYGEIVRMGGLESSVVYPYHALDESCKLDGSKFVAYINSSITLEEDEDVQATYLYEHGPLATTLNADKLQHYRGGIINEKCSTRLTHGVLTVGYGVEDNIPYWIVRNSWGEWWGEQGYFRIKRGAGTCGINKVVSSAVIH